MEDGEILTDSPTPGQVDVYNPAYKWSGESSAIASSGYDPAYEWPGESSNTFYRPNLATYSWPQGSEPLFSNSIRSSDTCIERLREPTADTHPSHPHKFRSHTSLLRLLVHRSTVLPSRQRVVLVDPSYRDGVQFGRDLSSAARVRLKEMAVSKAHASVFWDTGLRQWNVVDLGSKHGTFLSRLRDGGEGQAVRLSKEREASLPRVLHHLDLLSIGNTTFRVHVHADGLPCAECSPASAQEEVPLFSDSKKLKDRPLGSTLPEAVAPRDLKKTLGTLKQKLLTRHGRVAAVAGGSYVDRSARRRALHISSHPDSPGIPSPRTSSPSILVTDPAPQPLPPESAHPPAPLPNSNVGHRLLMKQGWAPGTALGMPSEEDTGLVEPLEVAFTTQRAGLGMPRAIRPAVPVDYREDARRKRWESMVIEEGK